MGPRDVPFTWRDTHGDLQHENLGKETVEVWIMPGAYRESWASWLAWHKPPPAELIFSSVNVRVYARPSARLTSEASEARLRTILKDASETHGLGSSEDSLSWSTWRADLMRVLAATPESLTS
jgi:hypothetical protein